MILPTLTQRAGGGGRMILATLTRGPEVRA
jgi:hypothetical protein